MVIVVTPDKKIDGHYLILLLNGTRCKLPSFHKVIGVIDRLDEAEQRTYNLAKRLAQERANEETYGWYNDKSGVPFVDNTSGQLELAIA